MLKRLVKAVSKRLEARKGREVQRILDRVISSSGYVPMPMCTAIVSAQREGVITEKERRVVSKEIKKYLKPTGRVFLSWALEQEGLPHSRKDCRRVYQDWKNRPKLTLHE